MDPPSIATQARREADSVGQSHASKLEELDRISAKQLWDVDSRLSHCWEQEARLAAAAGQLQDAISQLSETYHVNRAELERKHRQACADLAQKHDRSHLFHEEVQARHAVFSMYDRRCALMAERRRTIDQRTTQEVELNRSLKTQMESLKRRWTSDASTAGHAQDQRLLREIDAVGGPSTKRRRLCSEEPRISSPLRVETLLNSSSHATSHRELPAEGQSHAISVANPSHSSIMSDSEATASKDVKLPERQLVLYSNADRL
ncbi:hypothetical protein F4678DRAFT_416829 [Xylaria arbuscula]|nr:hypothetical protein F4678DRAFT_416829 [Xylaria arbuscula]